MLAVALVVVAACGGVETPQENGIEVVEVAPSRTSMLTTTYDEVAPQRRVGTAGILPEDFPQALPLYDPASLVDFGADDGGARYVVLFSPDTETMVRDRMGGELARSGWALIDGDSERGTWRRGSQSVILDVRDASPGTEIRVEY